MRTVQPGQNRLLVPALLALACVYLGSSARADIAPRSFNAFHNGLEFRHLIHPSSGSGTTDPNDTGTTSNHPDAGTAASAADRAALAAGTKVTGAPREIPWLWLIVTGALSLTALGMGGHIILRENNS